MAAVRAAGVVTRSRELSPIAQAIYDWLVAHPGWWTTRQIAERVGYPAKYTTERLDTLYAHRLVERRTRRSPRVHYDWIAR